MLDSGFTETMENKPIQNPTSKIQNGLHRSVFWKVAGILVGVQVVTGLMAVALGAWFANDRSRDLAANSLRLRLDGLAEEVEQRADSSLLENGLAGLPSPVRFDLSRRFRDPVLLLDGNGTVVDTIQPDEAFFLEPAGMPAEGPPLPEDLIGLLANGDSIWNL